MALLQISEPGMSGEPHKRNIAIGIDLGTTNSLVATTKSGENVILEGENNESLIPSVVYYNGNIVEVGTKALKYRVIDPSNTIISVKRFMGRTLKDLEPNSIYPYKFRQNDGIIEIETTAGLKNPVQISADILYRLKQIATDRLGMEPGGAVITVPAYFNDAQRQATRQAAELAGLHVLRLLSEPTAAAIAYGLDAKTDGVFLVFDLGGGTLDVSILKLSRGVFEVIAVSGDTHLGGDDFDHRLYCYILEKSNLTQLTDEDIAKLLNMAKYIKEELSSKDKVVFNVLLSNKRLVNLSITREEFDTITENLVQKCLIPIKKALWDAKLEVKDIDDLVMVGGSTRLLSIRSVISSMFECELLANIDPDKVVAIGAAIQADVLIGNRRDDWLLLDVTPLSLGLETMGGVVEKIIHRNSTIPITKAQDFTTYQDGQTAMSIHVVQGERELVSDCRSLARFSLRGIPPAVAGAAKIRVTFQIDADGLLSVSAVEETTGIRSSIEVKPSFGLSDDQIATMLKESIQHAKEDVLLRQLSEACVDGHGVLAVIENAIVRDGDLLTGIELHNLDSIITEFKQLLTKDMDAAGKTSQIKSYIELLNNATQKFASLRMDRALKQGLTGMNIDNI